MAMLVIIALLLLAADLERAEISEAAAYALSLRCSLRMEECRCHGESAQQYARRECASRTVLGSLTPAVSLSVATVM